MGVAFLSGRTAVGMATTYRGPIVECQHGGLWPLAGRQVCLMSRRRLWLGARDVNVVVE